MKPRPDLTDRAILRFKTGTFDRIRAILGPGEDRSEFIRSAVASALKRAEARAPDQRPTRKETA
jgi:hypothetical protein